MARLELFGDALGTDVLEGYNQGFGKGDIGLKEAKEANKEVRGNRPDNALQAIPSIQLLKAFVDKPEKIELMGGETSTAYLACLL